MNKLLIIKWRTSNIPRGTSLLPCDYYEMKYLIEQEQLQLMRRMYYRAINWNLLVIIKRCDEAENKEGYRHEH